MSDDIGAYALESRWARRSFDRAAKTYDDAAVLHAEVRDNLLARLELTTLTPKVVLDAGAGTGHGARALKRRYPKATVIALDFSAQMLEAAATQRSWLRPFERLQADAGLMPFKDGSVDLIVSNLMLQWCDPDTIAVLHELCAVVPIVATVRDDPGPARELCARMAGLGSHSEACAWLSAGAAPSRGCAPARTRPPVP